MCEEQVWVHHLGNRWLAHEQARVNGAPLLTSRSGRVKAARSLRQHKHRLEHGLFLAEGIKALTEALAVSGVREVFATAAAGDQYAAVRTAVEQAGIPWYAADADAIASLAGAVTPQGVVAVCARLDRELDAVIEEVAASATTLVICADVRDPGNAGTVIRTADAAGAGGVVLAGSSVDPYNDKTVRATVGSLWHLPIALAPDPADVVAQAQRAGFTVLAADGAGETGLFEADDLLRARVAWLFGNEARGLPGELAALADHRIAIPILGRAESLNLATAAAVCLYASARP